MQDHSVSPSRCSVLSVSPFPEDHDSLADALREYGWTIRSASSLAEARQALREHSVALVVCERDLAPGQWKDLLGEIHSLTRPPFLVVTSRIADEHLWPEALNFGVYEVLGRPFDRLEVTRTLGMAWLHWSYRYGVGRAPMARGAGA